MRRRDLSVLESEKHARARSEDGRRSPMKEEEGGEERMALHFMKLSRSRLSSICACLMMSCAVIRNFEHFLRWVLFFFFFLLELVRLLFLQATVAERLSAFSPVFFRVFTTGRKSDKELNDGI